MVKNQKQYNVTKSFIDKFTRRIEKMEAEGNVRDIHPRLFKAEIDGLKSMRSELQEEVDEYDKTDNIESIFPKLDLFDAILSSLIMARISLKLSEKELADMVGIKEQQIQAYESTEYRGVEAGRIEEIIDALKNKKDKIKLYS